MLKGEAKTAYQREYMRRRRAGLAKPTAKPVTKPSSAAHDALAKELAAAKAEIAALKAAEIAALLGERKAPRRAANAKPKAEKPPLPPDEVRDREIKSLKTANRNLRAKLHATEEHYKEAIIQVGGMPRETRIAIDKALHPDGQPSAADKDKASKGWNVWKGDNDKARRRAR